jgi:hypothetical protein
MNISDSGGQRIHSRLAPLYKEAIVCSEQNTPKKPKFSVNSHQVKEE